MRTELKAKLIQHLNARRDRETGFTLVELLVVIVIIGILTAIALPTFLNETAKAKQSEAKQNINTVNKSQVSRRAETQSFATTFDILAISSVTGGATGSTNNYSYTISTDAASDSALVVAQSKDGGLKGANGAVTRVKNSAGQNAIYSVICEMPQVGTTAPGTPTVTADTTPVCNATATKKLSL